MKTKFRQQLSWKNLSLIILHITFLCHIGHCRPPSSTHVDQGSATDDRYQVRPVYDLRNVGKSEIRGRGMSNNDTLLLYSDKDSIHFVIVSDGDDAEDDAIGDVALRVDVNDDDDVPREEGSPSRHQVAALPSTDRNLVRKRRHHPEQGRPHRRRRRKHRLVLKARDSRNHLSDEEDLKDRRGRYLIKSDSPGYLITSASEVKKDWCRTIPLRQKVSEPNCRSRVVQNNFCYGQCNSFFIPHTGRTDNKVAFQSCAFCKPYKQHWGNVTLNCPGRNPPKIEKTVLFVETCRCITEVLQ